MYGSAHSLYFKKSIYQQVLKPDANESSAQGIQNSLQNSYHTKVLIKLWEFENRQFCIWVVWSQALQENNPIQIIYQHLPNWLRIPQKIKKLFFKDATQKSARMVVSRIGIELQTTRAEFWKMSSSSRERGDIDSHKIR